MNMKEENICRLCLKIGDNKFESIDLNMRNMFDVLLLKMACVETATKSYYFKSECVDTEILILTYFAGKNAMVVDLKDVFRDNNMEIVDDDTNIMICRYCMNRIEGNNFDPTDVLNTFFEEQFMELLPVFVPEIDLNISKDSIICNNCKKTIIYYLKLVLNFLDTENKINLYCQSKGTNSMGQVKLRNIVHYFSAFKGTLDYSVNCIQTCAINKELDSFKEGSTENLSFEVWDKDNDGNYCFKMAVGDNILNSNVTKDHASLKYERQFSVISLDPRTYKCDICAHKTQYLSSIKNHILTHKDTSEVKMHKCTKCTYETKLKYNLKKHMLLHKETSEVKLYECAKCTFKTKHKGAIKYHVHTHNKDVTEVKTKCTMCTFETTRKGGLKNHMLVHEEASDKCPICTFQRKHKGAIGYRHIHEDAADLETFTCTICKYKTIYEREFKKHMLVHKPALKMYQCPMCSYQVKQKAYLTRHKLTHKETYKIKMYKCPLCTYETKQNCDIKKHMLVHKGSSEVETYKCPICTYATKHEGLIKTHMQIHNETLEGATKNISEVEMYQCPSCTYKTKYKHYMSRHMLIHKDVTTAERYKCTMCVYDTHRKGYLKMHMGIHEGKKYACTMCTYKTRRKGSLQQHILASHSKTESSTLVS